MNYEEYKSNLLEVKKSLIELAKIQEEKIRGYRQFIEVMSGNNRNQVDNLDIQYSNLKHKYAVQIKFIESLSEKAKYNEIAEDVISKLAETKSKANHYVNNTSDFNCTNNSFNKYDSLKKFKAESDSVTQSKTLETNKLVQTTTLDNQPYAKYYEEFLKEYQTAPVKYILDVNKKYIGELSNYNLSSWDKFAYKDIVSLSETGGNPKYYAYKLPNFNGKYYFAVPAKAVRFSEMQIIQAAILTFFDLPLEEIDKSCGVMPKLIKPAVLEKREDGFYYLKEKGKYAY